MQSTNKFDLLDTSSKVDIFPTSSKWSWLCARSLKKLCGPKQSEIWWVSTAIGHTSWSLRIAIPQSAGGWSGASYLWEAHHTLLNPRRTCSNSYIIKPIVLQNHAKVLLNKAPFSQTNLHKPYAVAHSSVRCNCVVIVCDCLLNVGCSLDCKFPEGRNDAFYLQHLVLNQQTFRDSVNE